MKNTLLLFSALLYLCSCNVTKHAGKQKITTDSMAVIQSNVMEAFHSIEGIDTTVYSVADTLESFADLQSENDTAVFESGNQQIIVTKPKGKRGVNVKAIAKPQAVNINTKKETFKVAAINTNTSVAVQRQETYKEKQKERVTPWYLWAVGILIVLCFLYVIYRGCAAFINYQKR